MGLLLKGQTECLICGRIIERTDEAVTFPAFLKKTHRLHRYSDGNFHQRCLNATADKEELERLYSRYREIWDTRPRNLKTAEEIEAWGKSAFTEFE
jgi:hypothetical protein